MTRHARAPSDWLWRQNHWLDCQYNVAAAGRYCGVRLVDENRKPREYVSVEEMAARARREGLMQVAERTAVWASGERGTAEVHEM